MSDNSDENEEEETLDLPSSSTTPLPSEYKDLTNLKTLAHLSPRVTPDLDDPMAGKPRWKEFRFSFLMWLIARGLLNAFIRNVDITRTKSTPKIESRVSPSTTTRRPLRNWQMHCR